MRKYSLTDTTLPTSIPKPSMFGTTSRDEIYGRRPSQTAKSPPAPLLAFRDFSKEAEERAKAGLSPTAPSPIATMAAAPAGGAISPTADKTDRRAHVVGSRSELYGRRPSQVGRDGRVPPAGKPEWVKGGADDSAVFEDDEDDKAEAKKA
ncbi:unnamed protein product [Cutaneotrichosporon oleaginosum]